MNKAKHIMYFTVLAFVCLMLLSFLPKRFRIATFNIKNIDLLSDVRPPNETKKIVKDSALAVLTISKREPHAYSFDAYKSPFKIVDYAGADSLAGALQKFSSKLAALKKGKQQKVRIAFIGDSMIEGDLITSDVRKTLQQLYGGKGIGFMPVTSLCAGAQATAGVDFSKDWSDQTFKNGKTSVFLSGHTFNSSGDSWFSVTDKTIKDSVDTYLLCGTGTSDVFCNDEAKVVKTDAAFNMQKLSCTKNIKIKVTDKALPVYGLSFESGTGVIVDNLSFRGVTGIELRKLDTTLLQQVNKERSYDLIVLEYGLNILDDNRDAYFKWYNKLFEESIHKVKTCFPGADILIISCGDRAFRKETGYETGEYVSNLVQTQATIAYNNQVAFFNLYESMGGKGSMVNWVTGSPSLAYNDYMHPNQRGSTKIAGFLTDAIIKEVNKVQ